MTGGCSPPPRVRLVQYRRRVGQCPLHLLLLILLLLATVERIPNVVAFSMTMSSSSKSSSSSSSTSSTSSSSSLSFQFRWGQDSDRWKIGLSKIRNLQGIGGNLNTIQPTNLLIAELVPSQTVDGRGDRTTTTTTIIGWAQITPLVGCYDQERDPKNFNARPGSYDLEADIDDQMWEEFCGYNNDDEGTGTTTNDRKKSKIPSGWASLPWTSEYKALEREIQQRNQRRQTLVEEAMKERRRTQIPLWELNQLFVEPMYRHQGVGTALVRKLCDEYLNPYGVRGGQEDQPVQQRQRRRRLRDVYLVTSHPRFFESCGFECITQMNMIPLPLTVRNGQVCMRGRILDENQQ